MSIISIGIPTVNGSHRLERCLSHIFKDNAVSKFDAEVLVVDDGSEDFCLEKNKEHCNKYNIELIEHKERKGVSKAWNTLVSNSKSELIILLNDDIEVNKYWLDVVIYTLSNNPKVGAIGLNSTDGQRLEPCPIPNYNECKLMFGSKKSPLLSCCGSAFAFRKSDWKRVGGFDERYFCFYEEIDFNISLLKIGKRSAMLSFPLLHHYVAETTTTVLSNPQQIMEESRIKFEDKWGFKWSEIRKVLNSSTIPIAPKTEEWNSTISFWG